MSGGLVAVLVAWFGFGAASALALVVWLQDEPGPMSGASFHGPPRFSDPSHPGSVDPSSTLSADGLSGGGSGGVPASQGHGTPPKNEATKENLS